jgi:hypothetical protein
LVQDTARLVEGVGIAVDAMIASHILGREHLIGKVAIRPLLHRPRWNGGAVHMTTVQTWRIFVLPTVVPCEYLVVHGKLPSNQRISCKTYVL